MQYRTEKDIMGEVKVPADSYYGIFTVRASENFPISGITIHPELNKAIINIKLAAALANTELKILDIKRGAAIASACHKLLKNYHDYEKNFILDVYQAGAGTPWHMNVNEVIANLALEELGKKKGNYGVMDPHDHINRCQSTNDVIPTAMRIACLNLLAPLITEINSLIHQLTVKSHEFKDFAKAGRTHLQDAVPITLGQEFHAWASDMQKRLDFLKRSSKNLYFLHIGGTAVGTGLNAPPRFARTAIKNLRRQTSLDLSEAADKIESTQFMSDFLDLSSGLKTIATDLIKIVNDIRLLNSGPVTGFREIRLPNVEPGSSIMPAKFNPSMAEMMNMICFQVIGNDTAIQHGAEAGQLELNVMTPLIAHNLLQSIDIMTNGIKEFNHHCVKGIKANKAVLKLYFEKNPSIGTLMNTIIGYDKTAELIKEALDKDKSIKEVAVEKGLLSEKEASKLFNIKNRKVFGF